MLKIISFAFFLISSSAFALENCSKEKRDEIFEEATNAKPSVVVDCHLKLEDNSYTITKKIEIIGSSSSGLTIDCHQSKIDPTSSKGPKYSVSVRSLHKKDGSWSRPENVTIKNCQIFGTMRVYGMSTNGEGEFLRESSHTAGHTARARANAPKNITLDHITLTGRGGVALYLSPGVTYSSFINSEIKGDGASVAIYLDTESGFNTIKNNYIHKDTEKREQIAIDGSAYNKIIDNHFSSLENGGIYLYRNCGEGGTVRHQSPQYNQIINNSFYYNNYNGGNPAIWLGSRNGFWRKVGSFFGIGYCHDDDGYPFGSSVQNKDFARYNVIAENQIYKLSTGKMIVDDDTNNYFYKNESVKQASVRKAGCFFSLDEFKIFLRDSEYIASRTSPNSGMKYFCNDNDFIVKTGLAAQKFSLECAKSGDNNGCQKAFTCPSHKKIIGVRALCNLETVTNSYFELSALSWGTLKVARPSDIISQGKCNVAVRTISQGQSNIDVMFSADEKVNFSCLEHDKNGGDCSIMGEVLCL